MAVVGQDLYNADTTYANLIGYIRRQHVPVRLPSSVWVPPPTASAPLGPQSLAATASALAGSPVMAPLHQLVISAISFTPPAVTTGGAGWPTPTARTRRRLSASSVPDGAAPDHVDQRGRHGDQLRHGDRDRGHRHPDAHPGRSGGDQATTGRRSGWPVPHRGHAAIGLGRPPSICPVSPWPGATCYNLVLAIDLPRARSTRRAPARPS